MTEADIGLTWVAPGTPQSVCGQADLDALKGTIDAGDLPDAAASDLRRTVKALAKELDVNETQVIHMALSKLASDVLPAYELDDGPITAKQVAALRQDVEKHFPRGKLISRASLFK